MKCAFVARDGATAWYLASVLAEEDALDALVIERGSLARRRQLARMVRRLGPRAAVDVPSLWLYGAAAERSLRRWVGERGVDGFPAVPALRVEDANEAAAAAFLRRLEPDLVVVSGTSILRGDILKIGRLATVNVHGGLLPAYRNVHSDFWAIQRGDAANVGSAIVHLDPGIDTGPIAFQRALDPFDVDRLRVSVARRLNLELAGELLRETVRAARRGELPREPQPPGGASYRAPGAGALARALLRRRL